MKRKLATLIMLGAILAFSAQASAKGTHFIAEHEVGAGITDNSLFASSLGVSLGYGGKFKGWSPRFYALMTYSHGMLDSIHSSPVSRATRAVTDDLMLFGPRLYIPVARNVRVLLQAEMGFAFSTSHWLINKIEKYDVDETSLATRVALGIQARINRWVSMGFMIDRLSYFGRHADSAMAQFAGLSGVGDEDRQTRLLGLFTFHF